MNRLYTSFFSLLLVTYGAHAQLMYTLDSTTLQIEVVLDQDRVNIPWDILWGPDEKLWLTDGPRVIRWDPDTDLVDTLVERPYGNGLGMALHPDFPEVPFLFVVFDTGHYYAQSARCDLIRFEYDTESDRFLHDTILLSYFHAGEHSGGRLIFDTTNHLLLTTADYWPELDTTGFLQGKVLRMNSNGSIPIDHSTGDLTFSKGHRNPQGICLLPNGSVVVSEHGQSGNNEINVIHKNQNYGWPVWDGLSCTLLFPDSCESTTYQNYPASALFDEPPAGIEFYMHTSIPEFTNTTLTGILWFTGIKIFKWNTQMDSIISQSYLSGDIWNDLGRIRDIAIRPDGSFYLITNDRQKARIRHVKPNITTKTKEIEKAPFIVWPNPARDEIFIALAHHNDVAEIQVFDAWGKVLTTQLAYHKNQIRVQIPAQSVAGLYFIRLIYQGKRYVEKVLVLP